MLIFGRFAVSRGVPVLINWPGRLAVAPLAGSIFFALVGLGTVAEILLYTGLALALWASVLYARFAVGYLNGRR